MSDFDIQHQVLRPKLIVCNGCTYRVLGDSALVDQVQDTDEHWDQQFSAVDFCEASNIMKDGEMYHLELKNIPTGLLAKILTEKLRKELEADSGVTIEIPPKGSKLSSSIFSKLSELVSPSEQGLAKAHDFIITLVESNRPKMTPNHFLSIPISTAEILQNYQDFAKKLQCDKEIKGISDKMFTAPPKLHITLMMLVLLNDDEKRRIAEDVEKMCSSLQPSLKNLPELTLQGLDIMNDDPTDVNVLYATVKDPSNSLQNFSDTLLEKLKPHPFTVDDLNRDSVKIHVTLMKTSADKQRKTRNGFDATKILEKYQDFYFGKFSPKSIHISARFNQDHSTGYYACLHEINL